MAADGTAEANTGAVDPACADNARVAPGAATIGEEIAGGAAPIAGEAAPLTAPEEGAATTPPRQGNGGWVCQRQGCAGCWVQAWPMPATIATAFAVDTGRTTVAVAVASAEGATDEEAEGGHVGDDTPGGDAIGTGDKGVVVVINGRAGAVCGTDCVVMETDRKGVDRPLTQLLAEVLVAPGCPETTEPPTEPPTPSRKRASSCTAFGAGAPATLLGTAAAAAVAGAEADAA